MIRKQVQKVPAAAAGALLAVFVGVLFVLPLVLVAPEAAGQSVPRLRISAARELCPATKCLVVYEGEEHRSEPCYLSLWCNGATACTVTQTLFAGWNEDKVSNYTIPPGGMIAWSGIYPSELLVYVGNGRLPWRIEAEGIRAWEAWETGGDLLESGLFVWPVKHLLRPTKVEVEK